VEDLRVLLKRDPQIVRWALKKMLLLERDPEAGEALRGGLIGWRKLTVSDRDWRVIWRVTHDESGRVVVDVAEVWAVGARSDAEVYAEMAERVSTLGKTPLAHAISDVMARLGKAGTGLYATPEPEAVSDLPDWLVRRLTRQAGLPEDEVRSMSLEEAFDAWTLWTASQPDSPE
jgi:mRNA interferase RelE/StbE